MPASLPTGPVNELATLNIVVPAGALTVPARHARTAREEADAAADLRVPVVLKLLSEDILNKSNIGGVLLGVQSDPVFGPIVMFGLSGIFVEALKDVTFPPPPSTSPWHER